MRHVPWGCKQARTSEAGGFSGVLQCAVDLVCQYCKPRLHSDTPAKLKLWHPAVVLAMLRRSSMQAEPVRPEEWCSSQVTRCKCVQAAD